ncbi:hypothetical protein IQ266_05875 [filamentous cyanobacterium LEGE 11480]|uniref:CheW-like domain-containing protein n=1 Tax=Romeriopsis navalis LEGE 11480 TaxID=2777977 RepID=A0A928VNT3_9CYAN|nr:hypothetical protein [Romeriopsis navalis]MBE9029289.1 hypothetical protein [Romeriopsis navalis LEGE 11480]
MLKAASAKRVLFETIDPESTLRVLVAPFKNLWLAVPMVVTRKIIRLTEAEAQLKHGDRLQVDNFSVQICRLYEHIYDHPNPQPETHGVVLHLSPTQILAVPMPQLPTIINLPKAELQPIGADYRDLFRLEVASHITLMPETDTERTVFLLDMDKLMELVPETL